MPGKWLTTTIGEQITLQRGFDITKREQRLGRVPVISSGGISSYHDTPQAIGPGVVIGRKGTLGKVFFLEEDYWPHDTTLWVKDFHGNDVRFVYYFLQYMAEDFLSLDVGSANPTLNRNHVHPLVIQWPKALYEQRAIARVLGTLDDKIELNRRMNATLEGLAGALFQKWCVENEAQVTTESAQALCDRGMLIIGDGYRAKRSELAATGLPFARAGNLDGGFNFADAEYLGESGVSAAKEKISRDFDAVFTSKGTVGRLAQVLPNTPRFVFAPQLCYWRVLKPDTLSPDVLFQWMKGAEFREQLDSLKGQTDMADYVSLGDQRDMDITLPFSADSRRVSAQIRLLSLRIDANSAQSKTLATLRDSLLPRLLSGELRLKDAERAVVDVA